MYPGSPAEPVLAAWGHHHRGQARVHRPGARVWRARRRLARLPGRPQDRGLASPLLVISDGAAGLIIAIEQTYPKALRQRCLVHRARNVLAKIPARMQAEVKDAYWKIFGTEDLKMPPRPAARGDHRRPDRRVRGQVPGALPGGGQVPAHRPGRADRLPAVPRRATTASGTPISSSAPLARPSAGSRSSAGSPARPVASPSCGPSWTASAGWRGFTMTSDGLRLLQDLRRQLLQPPVSLRRSSSPGENVLPGAAPAVA